MPTINRPATALMVVDVQVGVVAAAHRRDEIVSTIATLVERARREGTPVVWVQHSNDGMPIGTDTWAFVPELVPAAGEPIVHKRYGDSFEDTDLEDVLTRLNVGTVVISGAQTDACIRSTLHGAFVRGYDTWLVSDAHTTDDYSAWGAPTAEQVIAHTNVYWQYQTAPGRVAGVATAAEVPFAGVASA